MDKIIERIEREAGLPGLAQILAERLAPTDLQTLLLHVYRLRASQLTPAAVLASYSSSRFTRPAATRPQSLLGWEQIAYTHLPPEFEALALAPVTPLGTVAVVAPIDQNWAVATARNTEVVSDSTNVLALECAVRRRELLRRDAKSREAVHLAASQRLLRAQDYKNPNLLAHFSLFALCSAGQNPPEGHFGLESLGRHLRFYLTSLRALLGDEVGLQVLVADFKPQPRVEWVEAELLGALRSEFRGVRCEYDSERSQGRGYYLDLCFHILVQSSSGEFIEVADGGSVDWTRKYLSNAREQLVISGIGSERLCALLEA